MGSFWSSIGNGITAVADFIGGYPLFILLVGGGLFFFLYSKAVPLRYFGRAIKVLRVKEESASGQISSFQALASTVAATVGMGGIAGICIAISVGGPGTIFWMWVSALLGMATKFFEGSLAVMFKGKDSNGEIQGGPMYMITSGLGPKWKPMAIFFSIFGMIGSLCIMQANQLTEALTTVCFQPEDVTTGLRFIIGFAICAIVSVVILGGIKRIANVAAKLVPAMVAAYFLIVLFIIIRYINVVPAVFGNIFREAFTLKAGVGGGLAGLMVVAMTGIRRAALVNEAGVGNAAMIHGASKNSEPCREGLVAMIGPAIDSGLVCTLTALSILIPVQAGLITLPAPEGMNSALGLQVAIGAFDACIPGAGKYILMIMSIVFAFSTMFSCSYCGEKCTSYVFGAKNSKYYIYFFLLMLIVAAAIPLGVAVSIIDIAFALMALPTMITMFILAPKVKAEMKKYFAKKD